MESKGKECAIVCIRPNDNDAQVYALLVHEAVHIWQRVKELLGEHSPSAEFEAYSIQRISLELIDSWKGQHT